MKEVLSSQGQWSFLWLGERLSVPLKALGKGENAVPVKIWIPPALKQGIDLVKEHLHISRSGVVRFFLKGYLYGYLHLLTGQGMPQTTRVADAGPMPPSGAVQKSPRGRRAETIGLISAPSLGKNSEDLKFWVSQALFEDLQILADQHRLSLSQLVREILVLEMQGRRATSSPHLR
jgi:hypothetical protein